MGLTIHYSLRSDTRSPAQAHRLVEELRKRALDLPFTEVGEVVELKGGDCSFETLDRDNPLRWLLVQAGQYVERDSAHYPVLPKHVIAFLTAPGEGCEDANFGLCLYPGTIDVSDPSTGRNRRMRTGFSGWCWSSFCKTQYASSRSAGGIENFLRCHLCVVRMLDCANELGILARVSDEGEFWEKRDVAALAKEVGEWNEMMAGLVGRLKDMFPGGFEAPITQYPDFERLEARGRKEK